MIYKIGDKIKYRNEMTKVCYGEIVAIDIVIPQFDPYPDTPAVKIKADFDNGYYDILIKDILDK